MSLQHEIERGIFRIEVTTPRQNAEDLEARLQKFADQYNAVMAAGYMVCITDNPMGHLSFQGTDLITELGLPVKAGQLSLHLNTFHAKAELHQILDQAGQLGVKEILVVSGDGNERLPRLQPTALGMASQVVTAVELTAYILKTFPGAFTLGVAFNPYEPQGHELEKMRRKIEAGARFICTQPVIGRDERVRALSQFEVPVFVECWMSKKLHLLSECVGYPIPEDTPYNPMENLKSLQSEYPGTGKYLAMLGFKTQFPLLKDL